MHRQQPDQQVYVITGNTQPKRLGRIFPTGWTPLKVSDDSVTVAAATPWPNSKRGSHVTHTGTIEFVDLVKRQIKL